MAYFPFQIGASNQNQWISFLHAIIPQPGRGRWVLGQAKRPACRLVRHYHGPPGASDKRIYIRLFLRSVTSWGKAGGWVGCFDRTPPPPRGESPSLPPCVKLNSDNFSPVFRSALIFFQCHQMLEDCFLPQHHRSQRGRIACLRSSNPQRKATHCIYAGAYILFARGC